jgi:hypothetical protein
MRPTPCHSSTRHPFAGSHLSLRRRWVSVDRVTDRHLQRGGGGGTAAATKPTTQARINTISISVVSGTASGLERPGAAAG